MPSPRSSAAHASVAFLRIDGFAQQPVAEQARLKARLDEIAGKALAVLLDAERIVLDAPEGLAVVVLGNPRAALQLAWRVGADSGLPLSTGLSHGPVRVAEGPPPVLYGDALASAEAVARATGPGGVSASRDFRAALAQSAPSAARLLARSGSAVDSADRAHELHAADEASCTRRQRRFFASAIVAAAVILGTGLVMRVIGAPEAVPERSAAAPRPPILRPAPAPRPATLTLDIRPEGEIWVDGALKGKSPPLKKIQLPAGKHTIEIRSGKHKPLVTELAVGEGEELAVQHTFTAPSQPARPVWRRWIDKMEKAIK